jgi:DNA-binding NarL/FixJ family response regulator
LFRSKVERVRVLIVAADPEARVGLVDILGRHPAISVTTDADEAQVVVWDLGTATAPRPDAASAAFAIPVVALVDSDSAATDAMAAGVHAVLPRDAGVDLIAAAMAAVAHGLLVFDRAYAPGAYLTRSVQTPVPLEELTPRESDILQLLAEGMSNKAIAGRLGISEHTVKFHLTAILGKLDAHTRTEAVTRAARLGWIVL